LPGQIIIIGEVYGGILKACANVGVAETKPLFDLNMELNDLDMTIINDFFEAYHEINLNSLKSNAFNTPTPVIKSSRGKLCPTYLVFLMDYLRFLNKQRFWVFGITFDLIHLKKII
jgi:hypothetical protein